MMRKNNFLNKNIKSGHSRVSGCGSHSGIFDARRCCYPTRKSLLNKRRLRGRSPSASRTRFFGDDGLCFYNDNGIEWKILNQVQDDLILFKTRTSGFTLIELLVVVLIIGILAAVALPQYKVAVAKSRFANARTYIKALQTAQEAYYLANGTYEGEISKLDLDFNCERVQDLTAMKCDNYFVIDNLQGTTANIRAAYCPGHQTDWDDACLTHSDFLYTVWLDHSDNPGSSYCEPFTALGRLVCRSL